MSGHITMAQWLEQMEWVGRQYFELLSHEQYELEKAREVWTKAEQLKGSATEAAEYVERNKEGWPQPRPQGDSRVMAGLVDWDEDGLVTMEYWNAHFDSAAAHRAESEAAELEMQIHMRDQSRRTVAAHILQIAKQGLSAVHGNKGNLPSTGRSIGSTPLAEVIWEARNQALHWEEARPPNQSVQQVFDALEQTYPGAFSAYDTENLALAVLRTALDWRSWDDFYGDLMSLG